MKLIIVLHARDDLGMGAQMVFDTNQAFVLPDVVVWDGRAFVNKGNNSRDHSVHYHEANTFVIGTAIKVER